MKRIFVVLLSLSLPAAVSGQARPAITGISHIAVYTSHPDTAEKYYVHDIGLFKGPDPENPNGVRYYVNSTQFVEVLPLPAGAGPDRLDHLAYITADAEALRAYLAAHKVEVPARVEHGSDGSLWFHVKDPEGNVVGFVQPPAQPLSIAGANPIGHRVIHVGMSVKSRDTEDAFYRNILGFQPYWFGGMKSDRIDWVSQQVPEGHDWLEYMLSPLPANATPEVTQKQLGVLNHLSIGVLNMEKAVTTLDSEGRLDNQHVGPQIGRDGKWQYNLFDPDQTRLELMEYSNVEKPCCSPFTAQNPSPAE
ncbi:MAG: VOC family protein [Silvibacterium sp.]|nr:VOC family protein [Silvibacterium sp.]